MSTRISGTARITGTATSSVSQGTRVRSYQGGRVCACAECDTLLSIYNSSKYCGVHAKLGVGGRRRGAERPIVQVACGHCGTGFETANQHRKFCSDRCRMAAFARRKRAAVRAESRRQNAPAFQTMVPAPVEREAVVTAA